MIPGRLRQLRLQTFLKKRKGFVFVLVEKDPCQPERVLGAKIQHHMFYIHLFSSFGHFLFSNFVIDFTFLLMINAYVFKR
jgi:hypothetical protein